MARELRFYSLVLIITFILWSTPGRTTCPAPGIYGTNQEQENGYHNVYAITSGPYTPADVDEDDWYTCPPGGCDGDAFSNCSVQMAAGTYYDSNNHKWVLNTALTCAGNGTFAGNGYALGFESGY